MEWNGRLHSNVLDNGTIQKYVSLGYKTVRYPGERDNPPLR